MKYNIDWSEIIAWICGFLMVAAVATCNVKIVQSKERIEIEKIRYK